ncbi:MAG: hypothetical protein WC740_15520, partial [Verrucomicrobiia bacterium]
ASSHEHGGSDEVATATPTANAIPKADSAGRISSGWLADVQTVADMAARHALTVAFKVKQTDSGHIHLFLGGDITSEANWLDLGHCNVAPSNTAVPTITGTAQVDVQLTAVEGTYAGYPTPSHASWQWQVSDDGATGWSDISSATSSTYTPVSADEGKYLRAKEGQSNIVGTVHAYSAATGAIEAIPVPAKPDAPTLSGSPYWVEEGVYWQQLYTTPSMPENATTMYNEYSSDGGVNWTTEGQVEPNTAMDLFLVAATSQAQLRIKVTGPGGNNYSDSTATFYSPS